MQNFIPTRSSRSNRRTDYRKTPIRNHPGCVKATLLLILLTGASGFAAESKGVKGPLPGDLLLSNYFRLETAKVADRCLAGIQNIESWEARRGVYRQELFEMLGLAPLPEKTDLKPVITGRVEHELFTVEKLHFQSRPGLYVTANLYLPKRLPRPAPAILYLSGHGPVISNGISYGNKVAYQHHGAWFARNGYVCLILDTLQLGEIQGIHHGTYNQGQWWWNSRGYTPAGVEAWNSIRALDYLQTRPEVDPAKFGVTGRSGGGAYSWWIAAVDDRIQAAAPVAGITDLENHVVDGTVEGHCDCMFLVNTFRWDYPQVAALVAPRPLLIANTDSDSIFPLDGVVRLHAKVRHIYDLHKASDKLGLVITPGGHKDTQELQIPVMRWFNRHLKGEDPLIETAAVKFFAPGQLRVFDVPPADEVNTTVQQTFVLPCPAPSLPSSPAEWKSQKATWLATLREKVFAGWAEDDLPLNQVQRFSVERNGLRFRAFDFSSQPGVPLRLYWVQRTGLKTPDRIELNLLGAGFKAAASTANHPLPSAPRLAPAELASAEAAPGIPLVWEEWLAMMRGGFADELAEELAASAARSGTEISAPRAGTLFAELQQSLATNRVVLAFVAPRGIGLTAWDQDERKQTQVRRRFRLLGQTLDGMRVWDVRRAVQAARVVDGAGGAPVLLRAAGDLACDALYAALFEPQVSGLDLWRLPESHRQGPDLLNVLRILDVPQAVAMAEETSHIVLHDAEARAWDYPASVARVMGWNADLLSFR